MCACLALAYSKFVFFRDTTRAQNDTQNDTLSILRERPGAANVRPTYSAFAFSTTRAAPSAHILPRTQRARNGPGRGRLGGLALAPQRSAAAGGWEGLTCPSRSVIRKALEKRPSSKNAAVHTLRVIREGVFDAPKLLFGMVWRRRQEA